MWQQVCEDSVVTSLLFQKLKKNTMKYFRPLSESMIHMLKKCHQSELTEKHFTMEDMSYAVAPLFKRGLIELKKEIVENKYLHCIHLTKEGVEYLEKLSLVEDNS